MEFDINKEAPNVVTEAYFKSLMQQGYEAEVVCVRDVFIKSGVWYGEWILRVVSPDGTLEKTLVSARARNQTVEGLEFRKIKTVNGLIGFFQSISAAEVPVPLVEGGRSKLSLPDSIVSTFKLEDGKD